MYQWHRFQYQTTQVGHWQFKWFPQIDRWYLCGIYTLTGWSNFLLLLCFRTKLTVAVTTFRLRLSPLGFLWLYYVKLIVVFFYHITDKRYGEILNGIIFGEIVPFWFTAAYMCKIPQVNYPKIIFSCIYSDSVHHLKLQLWLSSFRFMVNLIWFCSGV